MKKLQIPVGISDFTKIGEQEGIIMWIRLG